MSLRCAVSVLEGYKPKSHKIKHECLVLNPGATPSIEESPITGEEVFILSDGRKVHHQSRMYIIPPIYYEGKGRSIFDFYNDEYLEADGHFILRIIGTNAR